MATTTTKPDMDVTSSFSEVGAPAWPREQNPSTVCGPPTEDRVRPTHRDALQALLAFSALHEQVRRRKVLAARSGGFDAGSPGAEFEPSEQFLLDEVLQLVAERAVAITGADGLAIALAENNEIVLRAAAGTVRPDVGARIDRDSAFSGASFRTAQIVMCDDTETDSRVNVEACRKLGARSMVAVPLCGRRRVIGLLEAFSEWPFAFNESDTRNLSLLAELVLGALKPEDEDRFAESAQTAVTKLEPALRPVKTPAVEPPKAARVTSAVPLPTVTAPAAVVATPVVAKASVQAVAVPAVVAPAATAVPVTAPAISLPAVVLPSVAASSKPVSAAPPAVSVSSVPVLDKDPFVAKASIAAAAAMLDKAEKTSKIEKVVTAEAVATPETVSEEAAPAKARPILVALLVFVVIVAAFAGGVWWKLKTAQLGGAMVQPTKTQKVPLAPSGSTGDQAPTAATTSPASEDSSSANDADEPDNSPATAQEISKFPKVTGIRHWSSADSSTIVLDLEDQVQYEAHRLAGPDRIYFDLRDTRLAPELLGKSIEVGDTFVHRVRMAQPVAGMTRVVLETKPNSTFSVSLEPNPYRLVVEVRKIGANPKGAVNLFPNANTTEPNKMAIVVPPPTKEDLQFRARVPKMRIVVDAGHGGWDLGTVGRRGLLEKDLVLEIAQRLGKLLETRLGTEVIYTRPDDNYITLDERASIANTSQADLFVSVHANYSDLPSARGVETYYTNFFTAPGSKDVDTRISATGNKPPVTASLSPADLHERIEQSRRLAASVQRSLYGTLSVQNPGLRDRGIKEAGFVVLTESAMPGILAEVSFVSSPTDEQKLRSDGYREQIAEALYKGIARYAANSRNVKVASARK
jgi:N-acetylmuramoyl-L-alanine amidase/putative methionine-R-sulfoxide reductase with GAF domain